MPIRHASAVAIVLLALAACGDDGETTPTGSASGAGGAPGDAGGVGGSGGVGATGTTSGGGGAASSTGGGGAAPADDLEELLARLRADRDGTLRQEADEEGWPVPVAGGRVVVSTDPAFDQVAGDFDGWAGTPLQPDDGFAWGIVPDAPGARYKLKAGDAFASDPWARAYGYDEHGEIAFVAAPAAAHLERWPRVEGAGLAARTVRVWVPAEAPTHVLYVHDGQNLFDPGAIWGGWRLAESAPPAMLLVGVDNTPDRMDEYTHVPDDIGQVVGGRGDDYAALVREVIRPMVDARYGEPPIVGTMGSSLGGLISLHLALHDLGDYAFAASLSGTLGWGSIGADEETMIERWAAAGHQPIAVYLDSGGGGDTCADADGDGIHDDDPEAADNYCETIQMRDVLDAAGWTLPGEGGAIDLVHWHEPGASHDEAAWAERVFRPLEMFASVQ